MKQTVHEISLLLGYEASRSLPTTTYQAVRSSPFTIHFDCVLNSLVNAGIAHLAIHRPEDRAACGVGPYPARGHRDDRRAAFAAPRRDRVPSRPVSREGHSTAGALRRECVS